MNLNIIGKRKIFFTISIVAMVLVLLVTIFVGPTLSNAARIPCGKCGGYVEEKRRLPGLFPLTVASLLTSFLLCCCRGWSHPAWRPAS